nr:MAG TPA: hypothetical protein [Caudoviricetes sp.]
MQKDSVMFSLILQSFSKSVLSFYFTQAWVVLIHCPLNR